MWYLIFGEVVVLIGLLVVPAEGAHHMAPRVAYTATVLSVLLWPVVVFAWFIDELRQL
jgi:hypothetical protein